MYKLKYSKTHFISGGQHQEVYQQQRLEGQISISGIIHANSYKRLLLINSLMMSP
jgi:hypothetical protein